MSVTSEQQLAKIEFEIWVTRLPSMSHPPPSIRRHRVTCLSLKNASAPWGQTVARWPPITISWVSYIQYLLACQKSQRSNPYNMVKSGLIWRRVFRRRHLGRRVTAVTCLRWPTVFLSSTILWMAEAAGGEKTTEADVTSDCARDVRGSQRCFVNKACLGSCMESEVGTYSMFFYIKKSIFWYQKKISFDIRKSIFRFSDIKKYFLISKYRFFYIKNRFFDIRNWFFDIRKYFLISKIFLI